MLPAIVSAGLGSASLVAYLFCGFLTALVMLCFAEAGSELTDSGGAYTYTESAFSNYAGFFFKYKILNENLFKPNWMVSVKNSFLESFKGSSG